MKIWYGMKESLLLLLLLLLLFPPINVPCILILWRYKTEFPDTHNTHAHAQLYVHATLLFRVCKLTAAGRLLAAALHSRHPHSLTHFAAA